MDLRSTSERVIYIAGKMTGRPDLGRAQFNAAAARLRAEGHIVLNPAELPEGLNPEAYMPICLAMIDAADALYVLAGWSSSRGAQIETQYAAYQGKGLIFEKEAENETE